jgi:HD superfamily phosphodiesterase
MFMNTLTARLLAANKQRYNEADNPLKSHGPDHHLRVYNHVVALAQKLGVSYDDEVLAGAALLHDMAAYYPEKTGEQYHEYDHKIAREVLEGINFPAEKIDRVVDAIANHGSDPKYKQQDEPIETTLLRDADKLDVFGPIGIARIIMVRTLKGDTLQDIVDDFWTKGHLERKWQSISTDAAREIAKEDYEYSRKFFGEIANKLKTTS